MIRLFLLLTLPAIILQIIWKLTFGNFRDER